MTEETIIVPATGNRMKFHDRYDTFLEVTGGSGNLSDDEVHLLMRSNDGEFAQAWFVVSDVLEAIERATSG